METKKYSRLEEVLFASKDKAIFHASRVSAISTVFNLSAIGLLASNSEYAILAGPLAILGYTGDLVDGKLARKYNLKSIQGEILDPLCDKIRDWSFAAYYCVHELPKILNTIDERVTDSFLNIPFEKLDSFTSIGVIGSLSVVSYLHYKSQAMRNRKFGSLFNQLKECYKAIVKPGDCDYLDKEDSTNNGAKMPGKIKTVILAVVGSLAMSKFSGFDKFIFNKISEGGKEISEFLHYSANAFPNLDPNYLTNNYVLMAGLTASIYYAIQSNKSRMVTVSK